jgi:PBP1b-binding outer membrane lipoprotein LpoB
MRWGIVFAAIFLWSCGSAPAPEQSLSATQRDEVADIAADAADDQLSSRIADLETRIDELESRQGISN